MTPEEKATALQPVLLNLLEDALQKAVAHPPFADPEENKAQLLWLQSLIDKLRPKQVADDLEVVG